MSYADESNDTPIARDQHDATLLLRELIADARNELTTACDYDERIGVMRDFIEVAQIESAMVGSTVLCELFTLLRQAVAP